MRECKKKTRERSERQFESVRERRQYRCTVTLKRQRGVKSLDYMNKQINIEKKVSSFATTRVATHIEDVSARVARPPPTTRR
jgi:hypothetical protein